MSWSTVFITTVGILFAIAIGVVVYATFSDRCTARMECNLMKIFYGSLIGVCLYGIVGSVLLESVKSSDRQSDVNTLSYDQSPTNMTPVQRKLYVEHLIDRSTQ